MTDLEKLVIIQAVLSIILVYIAVLHFKKEEINDWLDRNRPSWYLECKFCRGIHFGFILGVLVSIYLTLVYGYLFN